MTVMAASRLETRPLSSALGAEIFGVDLGEPLDDGTVRALRGALLEHVVIFFRDQELSPPQLLALAERFGEVVEYPLIKGLPECPLVLPVIKEPEERANFGGVWHSDTAYLERPAMASLLYALETPPAGGDTMFANMYQAYETLSEGMRRLLDGLSAVNVAGKAVALQTRKEMYSKRATAADVEAVEHGPSGGPHPSRDRAQVALRQPRPHAPLRGHDRGRERAAAGLSVRLAGPARVHLPVPLAPGLARVLGQSRQPALSPERLPRLPAGDAPGHADGRPPALIGARGSRADTARGRQAACRPCAPRGCG